MTRLACLTLAALPCFVCSAQSLTVHNAGSRAFQEVVQVPFVPDPVTDLVAPDGTICPTQAIAGGFLVLVPGALAPGEDLSLKPAADDAAGRTDLSVEVSDETIAVRNSFLGLVFPRTGRGGFPTAIEYPVSGHTETRWQWYDRLFDKERGQLLLHSDAQAQVTVVEEGPLQVTVEATAAYDRTEDAPGCAATVYRWTFRAYSPLVRFSATVSREDDFVWPELHVMQPSRKDDGLRNWAGEDRELQSGRLLDDDAFRGFGGWAALDDGQNALGLSFDDRPVTMYDGRSTYVTYLQHTQSFADKSADLTGRLYIGPALSPERYREQFAPSQLTAEWDDTAEAPAVADAISHSVANDRVSVAFEAENLGCVSLRDAASGHEFLTPSDTQPLTWRLSFRDTEGNDGVVDSAGRCRERTAVTSEDGRTLTLTWKGIAVDGQDEALAARVTVTCPEGDGRSRWSLAVENGSEKWSLMNVDFPVLVGLANSPDTKAAVPRSNWGQLHANFPQGGSYPSANWPMQFISVHDGDNGLYLGYEDGRNFTKSFHYSPGGEFYYRTLAEDATRPGNDFTTPGAVALAPCGDWWEGCKLYRSWALQQTWTREGPLTDRASMPEACKNLGLWFCGGGTAEQVIGNMRRAQDFFGVPVGLHWYSWHRWPFDTHYPDYFPAVDDFKIAIDALVPEGKVIMPYINGRLYDKQLEGWPEDQRWATKLADLTTYQEVYPSQAKQAIMCPATDFWQDKIAEVCEHLCGFYGVNGIYIDQIAAAGPCPCYDPTHGHPLGGGSYWVDGYRVMLEKVQRAAHAEGRDVLITTENNAEPYMDGVDCFLIWNPRMPDEIPMMTAVYSGYSLYFASNARCDAGLQPYAMIQGRDFVWGSQLGWMGFEDANPTERGEYLRQVVRLRHAALKYVVYGEVLEEIEIPESVGTVTGSWRDWEGKSFDATLPAVMGNVWKGSDGSLGLLMANLSPETRVFDYELDTARFGELAGEGDCLLLTDIRKEGDTPAGFSPTRLLRRTEVLQPWEAKVIQVTRVPSAAAVASADEAVRPADARRASAEAWAARHGTEWKLAIPVTRCAARDTAMVNVAVKPGPGQPMPTISASFAGSDVFREFGPDPATDGWLKASVPVEVPANLKPGDRLAATATLRLDEQHAIEVPFEITVVPDAVVAVGLSAGALRAGEDAVLWVELQNNLGSALPAGTRVRLDVPDTWDLWPGRALAFAPVSAHGRTRMLVRCSVPQDAPAEAASVAAYLVRAEGRQRFDVAPPRPHVQALRLTPTVDGDLSEWTMEPSLILGPEHAAHVSDYGGPEDLSARVWLAADDDFFYIAAEVTDDIHVQDNTGKMMWSGDCLQIDLRPGTPPWRSTFSNVCELGLAFTPVGPQLWQWTPREGLVEEGKIAITRGEGRTRYEAAVPWAALPGVNHTPGAVNAFSMTVNEADGDTFGGWLQWTPGICGGKDASQFGLIVF
jgi:hypothetical protein